MKSLIKFLFILCITSCTAQTPKNKKMETPLTDKEIKEKGYQIKREDTIFMKDGKLDIAKLEEVGSSSGTTKPPYYQYRKDIDVDLSISISGDQEDGYSKKNINKKVYFEKNYNYFPNGELKQYGVIYPNFFKKGIWYWYDKEGSIEKYEDYDSPFEYSWENVLEFLKKQKIKKQDIYQIGRGIEKQQALWYISFKTKELYKTDKVKDYTLDGKTGKILKEEIRDVSRQLD